MSLIFISALLIVCIVFFLALREQKNRNKEFIELLTLQLELNRALLTETMNKAEKEREQLLDRLQSENLATYKTYTWNAPAKSSGSSNFLKQSIDQAARQFQHENIQL